MLGEGDGLKGCAARTGKPPSALAPLALPQRLADMPFCSRCVRRPGVSSLLCTQGDFSNLRRQITITVTEIAIPVCPWPPVCRSGHRHDGLPLRLSAVRPERNTSKPHPAHQLYPYLLGDRTIDQPNQVWATDITYIPMRQGFLYLVAIIDWATRRVLSWGLSNSLTATFCIEALSEALARFGKPEIFNSDQGSQFTSEEFTRVLLDHGIEISMDGRGRCHDNIFVERLWWTLKHEWVYLRPAANGLEQKRSLVEFFDWYNRRRPHQALGWQTPDEAYFDRPASAVTKAA